MLSRTKVVVAAAGVALSLGLGTGVASAEPDVSAVVNTTCSYPQLMGALNAQSPAAAAEFTGNPVAVAWVQNFLASPVEQRRQMLQQVQSIPAAQEYTGLVQQVIYTCKNF
jgi:hemophore-related protein